MSIESTHPSIARPFSSTSGHAARGRASGGFAARLEGSGGSLPRVASVAADIAPGGGAFSVAVRGVQALFGGEDSSAPGTELDELWQMQAESQAMNVELLALQRAAQDENRHFSTVSNLLKARHDTAKVAIGNIRV